MRCLQNYVHIKMGKISPYPKRESKPIKQNKNTVLSLMIFFFFKLSKCETKLLDDYPSVKHSILLHR